MKKLGEGYEGEVFKTPNNKIYKIARSDNSLQQMDLTHPFWREVAFADFAKEYPNYFMKLEKYGVDLECKHKRKIPEFLKGDPKETKNWKKTQNEPYCVNMTYSPVLDGTLNDLYKERNKKYLPRLNRETWEFPSDYYKITFGLLLQQFYILYLLAEHDWIHTDAHVDNWLYAKTNSYIRLEGLEDRNFKYKFPYQLMLCDYGRVMHKNFPNKEYSTYKSKRYTDFIFSIVSYFYQPPILDILGHKKYSRFISDVVRAAKQEVSFRKTNTNLDNNMYFALYAIKYPVKFAELTSNKKIISQMIQYPAWEIKFFEFILNNYHRPIAVLDKIAELYKKFT